jgi:tetratricopeptide (TPR) repeat protein
MRRLKMKKSVVALACVLALAAGAFAQDYKGKGRIIGTILDQDGKPVEGVKVTLFLPSASGGFSVQTDKDGHWVAAWIKKGTWDVDFEKIGYEPKKISVPVNEPPLKNPEIKLSLKKVEGIILTKDLENELGAANALFNQKDFQGALAAFQAMVQKYPDAYILWKNVGNCYFALEQYDKAEEAYLKILEKDPANPDAIVLVGNTYANRKQDDKALEWYNKLQIDKIKDSIVLYNIGNNYYNLGKYEDAYRYYKQAVAIQADNLDALYQLGLVGLNLQKNEEAIAAFEGILKIDPDWEKAAQVRSFLEYLKKK